MALSLDSKQITSTPPQSPLHRTRKVSSLYEEDITIHPSTELIPDEYEHEKVSIHIFSEADEELFNLDPLTEVLQKLPNINKNTSNFLHFLRSVAKLEDDLNKILTNEEHNSALFLLFVYVYKKEARIHFHETDQEYEIKNIWTKLSAQAVAENFVNKPKALMFLGIDAEALQSKPLTDGFALRKFANVPKEAYKFPVDSDILVMNKKFTSLRSMHEYIEAFAKNVDQYNDTYDVIDLFNISQNNQDFAITVSTLTRKFYLVPNEQRELYLAVSQANQKLKDNLDKLHEYIKKLASQKQEKPKFFSFRRKSDEKPKVEKKMPTSPKSSTVKDDKSKKIEKKTNENQRRPSVQKVTPSTSRRASVMSDSVADVKKKAKGSKPIWKW